MKNIIIFVTIVLLMSACTKKATFTITLNQNSSDVKGAILTLADGEGKNVYTQTAETSSVVFKNVVPGEYTLTVEHENFYPYTKEINTTENNGSGFTAEISKNGPGKIVLKPNYGNADGATVDITDMDGNSTVETSNGNTALFYRVPQSTHGITIIHHCYFTYHMRGFSAESVVRGIEIELYRKGPAGGIVFYDKGSYSEGWQYLEAALSEHEFSATWGHTQIILKKYLNINGFQDWRLPTIEELNLMYDQIQLENFDDVKIRRQVAFQSESYWSSTTQNDVGYHNNQNQNALCKNFDTGDEWAGREHFKPKGEMAIVRAVRAF